MWSGRLASASGAAIGGLRSGRRALRDGLGAESGHHSTAGQWNRIPVRNPPRKNRPVGRFCCV